MIKKLKGWHRGKSVFSDFLAILITTLFSTTTTVKAEELGVDGSTGYSYLGVSPNINGEYYHNPIYKLEMMVKKVFCIESGIYTTGGAIYYLEPYISSKKDLLLKLLITVTPILTKRTMIMLLRR